MRAELLGLGRAIHHWHQARPGHADDLVVQERLGGDSGVPRLSTDDRQVDPAGKKPVQDLLSRADLEVDGHAGIFSRETGQCGRDDGTPWHR